MVKTKYSLKASLIKTFEYISLIAKEPIHIKIDKIDFILDNQISLDKIIVSDNYFRDYSCMDFKGCDICCHKVGFWNIFTEGQYKNIKSKGIVLTGELRNLEVNGNKIPFYIENHENINCSHLKGYCEIHFENPIHCMWPLRKMKLIKDTLYITTEVFGRNWAIGCPVGVKVFKPISKERFNERCILPLEKLKMFADSFKIETHIDYLINLVKFRYVEWENISVVKYKSLDNLF